MVFPYQKWGRSALFRIDLDCQYYKTDYKILQRLAHKLNILVNYNFIEKVELMEALHWRVLSHHTYGDD